MNNSFNQAISQYNYGVAQHQALQNIQGGIWGDYSYGSSTGTTFTYYDQPVMLGSSPYSEEPKKKKRMIVELREELNKWHGPLWSEFAN